MKIKIWLVLALLAGMLPGCDKRCHAGSGIIGGIGYNSSYDCPGAHVETQDLHDGKRLVICTCADDKMDGGK